MGKKAGRTPGMAALEKCGFVRRQTRDGAPNEYWDSTPDAKYSGALMFSFLYREYIVYADDDDGEPLPIWPDLADAILLRLRELGAIS